MCPMAGQVNAVNGAFLRLWRASGLGLLGILPSSHMYELCFSIDLQYIRPQSRVPRTRALPIPFPLTFTPHS